jgi:DnaJ-class molecular chaperone
MADPQPSTPAAAGESIDLTESVAGEEDPGASIDLAVPAPAEVCSRCGGSGRVGALNCPECGGTGKAAAPGAG